MSMRASFLPRIRRPVVVSSSSLLACLLVSGCSSASFTPSPPPPPASLTELTEPLSLYPSCDSSVPACKARIDEAYPQIYDRLNSLLSRNLAPVVVRIDTIRESDGGWWANGPAVWDKAGEQNQAAVGAGMATGFLSLLSGSSPLGAVEDGANVGASLATKEEGKCLTSADSSFKGVSEVQVFLEKPKISTLDGFEKGKFVRVEFSGKFWPFKQGGMFDEVSNIYSPGRKSFGSVSLHSVGATVTPVSEPELFEHCLSSS